METQANSWTIGGNPKLVVGAITIASFGRARPRERNRRDFLLARHRIMLLATAGKLFISTWYTSGLQCALCGLNELDRPASSMDFVSRVLSLSQEHGPGLRRSCSYGRMEEDGKRMEAHESKEEAVCAHPRTKETNVAEGRRKGRQR